MADWSELLQEMFADSRLAQGEREEVIAELCSDLEDRYGDLLREGMPEAEAMRRCLEELDGLGCVTRRIGRAKAKESAMNRRTRTLWLPGFVSLAAASISMMFVEFVLFFRDWVNITNQLSIAHVIWLVLLPACGAAGAFVSRRGEGSPAARLAAGLFPSLAMLCVFLLVLPFDLFVNRNANVVHHPQVLLTAMWLWVVSPGLALLVGVAPFCVSRRPTEVAVAE